MLGWIKSFFKGVADKNTVSSIGAGYTKRVLEKPYDKLFETELGQKLKELEKLGKDAIEFVLYFANSIADKKLPEGTILQKWFKETFTDMAPELSKRMQNNDNPAIAKKDLMEAVLELEKAEELIVWTHGLSEEKRKVFLKQLKKLADKKESLEKISGLSSENRNKFLEIFEERGIGGKFQGNLNALGRHLREYLEEDKKGGAKNE